MKPGNAELGYLRGAELTLSPTCSKVLRDGLGLGLAPRVLLYRVTTVAFHACDTKEIGSLEFKVSPSLLGENPIAKLCKKIRKMLNKCMQPI